MIYPAATATYNAFFIKLLLKHNHIFQSKNLKQIGKQCIMFPVFLSDNHSVTASASTDSAHLADLADRAAVLSQVLRAVEGTGDGWLATGVDGSVTGAANCKLSERVELDVDGVCGLAFGDGFKFAGLEKID